ncbi:hypothetical protein Glove_26g52 [Diversispora epigaea]|uniref:Uncharacterized protein n=1 Tax=Diversispora epigaea TaxID=1348612 RepID=A0A397JLC5_9GLOM|nr:hypothetical protein Glove_26g52 [Diversispora epigaea]
MGDIEILLESYNENVDQENLKILYLRDERQNLIETILYQDSIDKLLQKWNVIIKKMACEVIPKRKKIQWLATWSSHLEIHLNNYKCSGDWYHDFLEVMNLTGLSSQRLVAYSLLQNVIKLTFSENITQNNSTTYLSADPHLIPKNIIVLESAEALKFAYIIGWIVYKLTKSDNLTRSHPEFEAICTHLMVLNSEQVVYEQDVRSQITNIIPGQEFLEFMYKMESLILLLFEKHEEFGPNILQYIHNSLLCNLSLIESFNTLIDTSSQILYTHDHINIEKYKLTEDIRNFLYERTVSIYMRSRQKTWRKYNELIPEKGSSSLRENFKTMRNDIKKNENKSASIKKSNIPKDPILGLNQLRIWTHLEDIEKEFSKIFLVSELQWLLWAFGDNSKNKRKKNSIPLILDHLKKETPFTEEALMKSNTWDEAKKIHKYATYFKDNAEEWFEEINTSDMVDWTTWKVKFVEKYYIYVNQHKQLFIKELLPYIVPLVTMQIPVTLAAILEVAQVYEKGFIRKFYKVETCEKLVQVSKGSGGIRLRPIRIIHVPVF